jgi:hypothetical protein
MKTTPTPPTPTTRPWICGAEDDLYSTFVVHSTARSGGVSSSPDESTFLSCRSLRTREREEACEREREEARSENWWCMSVLHFCVAGKARPKMGSAYGSSVGDHLGVLQYYFVPHFEFCSFRWR